MPTRPLLRSATSWRGLKGEDARSRRVPSKPWAPWQHCRGAFFDPGTGSQHSVERSLHLAAWDWPENAKEPLTQADCPLSTEKSARWPVWGQTPDHAIQAERL